MKVHEIAGYIEIPRLMTIVLDHTSSTNWDKPTLLAVSYVDAADELVATFRSQATRMHLKWTLESDNLHTLRLCFKKKPEMPNWTDQR